MSGSAKSEANGSALLSVGELAGQASVSRTAIRRLIWSGQLPAVKVGRLVRVRLSDWQAYLDAHRVTQRAEPALPAFRRGTAT